MGCISSNLSKSTKETGSKSTRDNDEEVYLSLRRRFGMPNQHKVDGFEFGLCVKGSNEKVSIKEFSLQRCDPNLIVQEVANLARLSHESFPKVLELFQTDTSVYMVTTYVDIFRLKNAVDIRCHSTSLSLPEIRKIFKCLSSAVLHCHDRQMILRCLLPENITVMHRSTLGKLSEKTDIEVDIDAQICDVAMAIQVPQRVHSIYQDHPLFDWSHVPYLAPEVALKLSYSFPCDYWCLGILLYYMISAHVPIDVDDPMDRALLLQKIKNTEYSLDSLAIWQSTRAEIKHLIRQLLQSDPLSRVNITEMQRNQWLAHG